jgi:hypothetical protein
VPSGWHELNLAMELHSHQHGAEMRLRPVLYSTVFEMGKAQEMLPYSATKVCAKGGPSGHQAPETS